MLKEVFFKIFKGFSPSRFFHYVKVAWPGKARTIYPNMMLVWGLGVMLGHNTANINNLRSVVCGLQITNFMSNSQQAIITKVGNSFPLTKF